MVMMMMMMMMMITNWCQNHANPVARVGVKTVVV